MVREYIYIYFQKMKKLGVFESLTENLDFPEASASLSL